MRISRVCIPIIAAVAVFGSVLASLSCATSTSKPPYTVGYAISGTVTYAGSQTGRIYVGVSKYLGTSIASPGPFAIRGIDLGSYVMYAWMDNDSPQTGVRSALSPSGSLSVTVSGDLSGQIISLSDPSPTPAPDTPTNVTVFPSNSCALVQWDSPRDANGNVLAQYYNIYYSTSGTVSPTTGIKEHVQASTERNGIFVNGLVDGQTYFFVVTAELGGAESAASAPAASATVGAPTGLNNVSGTVTFPGAATGPMYVVLYSDAAVPFFQCIGNPASPQPYSISGVANGAYLAFTCVDMNNDGVMDIGDIRSGSNLGDSAGQTLTVNGNLTGMNQTLSAANASFEVLTSHFSPAYTGIGSQYSVRLFVAGEMKLPVQVTVISGPNEPVPLDMSPGPLSRLFTNLGSARPNVGDSYVITVTYSDGTSENLTDSVTAVLDSFAENLTTSGTDPGVPIFQWTAPTSPPSTYTYQINVTGGGELLWSYPSLVSVMPSWQTSVVFNLDGKAQQSSLTAGNKYWLLVLVHDAAGNRAATKASYTPTS